MNREEIISVIARMSALGYHAEWNDGGSWTIDVAGLPPADDRCPLCGYTLVDTDYLDSGDSFIVAIRGCEYHNVWWCTGESPIN